MWIMNNIEPAEAVWFYDFRATIWIMMKFRAITRHSSWQYLFGKKIEKCCNNEKQC